MEQILFAVILAFITTLFAIPKIIYVSEKKKLFDNPDNVRKLHKKPVCSLGGLGIFIGFTLSVLFSENFFNVHEFQYYIAAFIIIFFVGIKDDFVELSAVKKLIGQALVACILMFKGHLLITDMHGFMGMNSIYTSFSYFLTFFTILIIINAFNLIDGVDGLAGSLGLISSLVFGAYFFINNNLPYAILASGFAGGLLAFLVYNFHPAKIFMGDTGSLLMGVVNSILVIKFIETGSGYHAFPVLSAPAIGFSILLLPLMDTLRVFSIRILNGRSPFSPDRNHIHHLLLERGLTHSQVTFACTISSLIFIAAGFLFQNIGSTWLIALFVTCFSAAIYGIKRIPSSFSLTVIKSREKIGASQGKDEYLSANAAV